MDRRDFLQKGLSAGALIGSASLLYPSASNAKGSSSDGNRQDARELFQDDFVIERAVSGRPHEGKVLAVIQPHSDDIALFAAGTVAKLIREGYKGYLIRITNDEKAGRGETVGDVIRNNERDNEEIARILGLERLRWGTPSDRKTGEMYGLRWAERMHYIGPQPNRLAEYIEQNAVPI